MTTWVAITVEGTIHHASKEGSFNREDSFLLELCELLSVENLMNYVVIMDNATILHKLSVPEGLSLKYLPPYSPFLNPIEAVLSMVNAGKS